MARTYPSWVSRVPNGITIARLACIVPCALLIMVVMHRGTALAYYWLLVLMLITVATDAIDGWWARRFNCVTTLGKHLDPLADKVLILLFIPLACEGIVHWFPLFVSLCRDWLITTLREFMVLQQTAQRPLAARMSGKIRTVINFTLLVIGTAALHADEALVSQWMQPHRTTLMHVSWIMAITAIWSCLDYYLHFRKQGYTFSL